MKPKIFIHNNKEALARSLADAFVQASIQAMVQRQRIHIALSGGSTPTILYEMLAKEPYLGAIDWRYFHLFWGDERCVPADHIDSNFGVADRALLKPVQVPGRNIHRISGDADPKTEAQRYAREMLAHVPLNNDGIPRFDWIFLGLGADGHTASLFPNNDTFDSFTTIARHPQSNQKRISLTLPVINAAKKVSFMVTGENKRDIVDTILRQRSGFENYPAGKVNPADGVLEWHLDTAAANILQAAV